MPDIDADFRETSEPGGAQQGFDPPGPLSSWTDLISYGVYNGAFAVGPPDPAATVDPVGAAGSNFVPGWRFVQSSNTTISGSVVSQSVSSTGSNFRFTHDGTSTAGTSYIEQIIDMGGSQAGDNGSFFRLSYTPSGLGITAVLYLQWLNEQGTIAGMPAQRSASGYWSGSGPASIDDMSEVDNPPPRARYLRIRISATSSSPGATLDVWDIRRDRSLNNLRFADRSRVAGKNGLYDIWQNGSNLYWAPSAYLGGTSTDYRVLNWQLVPVMFSLTNIPANAVTDMQLWGDSALSFATPRIGNPWPASIVGASYRLSAIPTAGGTGALKIRVQVGGSTVWTPFTLNGSGGAISDETTQGADQDEMTAGQQLGVVVDTTATYAPTTADLAVIVWLAVKLKV